MPDSKNSSTGSIPNQQSAVPRVKIVQKAGHAELLPDCKLEEVAQAYDSLQIALGAEDRASLTGTLRQIAMQCTSDGTIDEGKLNHMIAFVKGAKPKDQVEASLAVEMVTVHSAMMKISQDFTRLDTLQEVDVLGGLFNRLARTYAIQMETLQRYRSSDDRTITVQNVSVSQGGQAIVGNVTQNAAAPKEKRAAAAPALTNGGIEPMPLMEKSGEPVLSANETSGE